MNYTFNEKSKTISVSGKLTDVEQSIIAGYISAGWKVREKRKSTAVTVKDEDIIAYFDSKKDEAGKKTYEDVKAKQIEDKNGDKRKGGFLKGLQWFKKNHAEAYKEIKEEKKKNNKK